MGRSIWYMPDGAAGYDNGLDALHKFFFIAYSNF